ncbi:DNA-3-methyladenine glycosylase [Pseudokineococcus marinus]|uniref:Putative 3-methyladenine DNA glycosylase n=1 Tax=Pseudokineococcus marinus TaxID=351215 RepID=A0A849BI40_9ACTN|nr:DNA-3-methyladenine glycosylase [Pseudokineococcus marinus]
MAAPLTRAALARPVLEVAADLLGCHVVHATPDGAVVVRLTEVEAYAGPGDPGSHAARGRTPRTAVMFGPPGHLYVYRSYGLHWCANVVCGPDRTASAVLLRGGEVVAGGALARARRPTAREDRDLARGPARLTVALGLDGASDGHDLLAGTSPWLLGRRPGDEVHAGRVRRGPRTGVSGEGGDGTRFPWRLHLEGEPSVSPYRRAAPRRPRGRGGPAGEGAGGEGAASGRLERPPAPGGPPGRRLS